MKLKTNKTKPKLLLESQQHSSEVTIVSSFLIFKKCLMHTTIHTYLHVHGYKHTTASMPTCVKYTPTQNLPDRHPDFFTYYNLKIFLYQHTL